MTGVALQFPFVLPLQPSPLLLLPGALKKIERKPVSKSKIGRPSLVDVVEQDPYNISSLA